MRVRAATYVSGGLILAAAGVGATTAGRVVLAVYALIVIWSIHGAMRRGRRVHPAVTLFDVLSPVATGLVVGHNPYSLHLLVGSQMAVAFLVARPRAARLVGMVGAIGICVGMVGDSWPTPIVLSPSGYRIAETGAVLMGLALGTATVAAVATRMWSTRQELRIAAETEHRHLETMRRFVAMVNHELRTPLTSVRGYVDVLQGARADLTEEEIEEFLGTIAHQSRHLSRLVDDILVFFQLEADRLTVSVEAVRPSEVIESLIRTIDIPTNRRVTTYVDDAMLVAADPDRLFQVLRNLLENSLKYGGPRITIRVERMGDRVRIAVLDDGPGVPGDRVDEIFDVYRQLGPQGSGFGLGLPIVRRLVEAMGGSITYDAVAGSGSCFVVDLPSAAAVDIIALPAAG